MSVTVTAEALDGLAAYFQFAPDVARQAARMALNDVAGGAGLKLLREGMEDEVAFPTGYIDKDKLFLKSKATDNRLTAVVGARNRATSLARFATPGQTPKSTRGKGVTVQVHRGVTRTMASAFLVRLRSGVQLSDEVHNVGLAVRLKPGDVIHNKRQKSVQLGHNLYLLYGPSPEQVFQEVATEKTPAILDRVEGEFFRQFNRMNTHA
jgi:hypothetical protein